MIDPNSCAISAGTCPSGCTIDSSGACMVGTGAPTNPRYGQSSWFCARGMLGDGVPGTALKNDSPRPFMIGSLTWGPNTWSRHYAFSHLLGSVAERISAADQTGFSLTFAWGINPNDNFPDGSSKKRAYLAALAVKMASQGGAWISPYDNADRTAGRSFDARLLNQCESGYRQLPDLASNGTLSNGILFDLSTSPWYASPSSGCSWAQNWSLPMATVKLATASNGATCTAFDVGGPGQPLVGINLGDDQQRRCPTWTSTPR
jgi:hypothetical protein